MQHCEIFAFLFSKEHRYFNHLKKCFQNFNNYYHLPFRNYLNVLLKFIMPKFVHLYFFFFFGGPSKLPDFIVVEISLWWSDIPVSNVLENLNTFDLLKCDQCSLGCVNGDRCVNLWAHLNWTIARVCPRGYFQYS